MKKRSGPLIPFGVTSVLLLFACVPIMFILYGGAGAAVGGLMLLAPFMAAQYLVFLVVRRLVLGRRISSSTPSGKPSRPGSDPS